MANEPDLKLIQIPEFPKTDTLVGSGPEYVVLTKADGVTYGMLTEDFKAFLGTVQVQVPKALAPTDPAPALAGVYYPTITQNEGGTPIVYTNAGGIAVNTAEGGEDYGKQVQLIYDGTVWVKASIPLPLQDVSDLATKEEVEVKANASDVLDKEKYIAKSTNYISKDNIKKGYWTTVGGLQYLTNTDNWISAVDVILPQTPQITVGGSKPGGTVAVGVVHIVFKDATKSVISHELANGSIQRTFNRPGNAVYADIVIANELGIGLIPQSNPYADTIMLNEGGALLPYEPFGDKIKAEKINYDFAGIVKESGIAKLREIQDVFELTPSDNLINKDTELLAGNWSIHPTTSVVSRDTSLNWLSLDRKTLQGGTYYLQGALSFGAPGINNPRVIFLNNSNAYISHLTDGQTGSGSEFSFTTPWGVGETGKIVINLVNKVGIGSNPSNNEYANATMLNKGGKLPYEPYGESLKLSASHVDGISGFGTADLDKIIVKKESATVIRIYYRSGGNEGLWVGLGFKKFVNAGKFINIWRIDTGFICKRIAEFQFTDLVEIIQTGVWENAIYTTEPGYDNALGSSHGWEMLSSVSIMLDGQAIDVAGTGDFKCSRFEAQTVTDLTTPDGVQSRATSTKKWVIENGLITIKNLISWGITTGISERSFVAMCPVNRNSGDVQVTNRGMRNIEWQWFDVSQTGFVNPLSTEKNNDATIAIIEGLRVVVEMNVKKASPVLPKRGLWYQNTPGYNKIYFQLGETTAAAGSEWDIEVEYLINIK